MQDVPDLKLVSLFCPRPIRKGCDPQPTLQGSSREAFTGGLGTSQLLRPKPSKSKGG